MSDPHKNFEIKPIADLNAYYKELQVESGSNINPLKVFKDKIQNFSPIGPYFWYILDFSDYSLIAVGGDTKPINGVEPEDMMKMDRAANRGFIYEEDLGYTIAYNRYCWKLISNATPEERKNLVCTHTVRIQNKSNGEVKWVLVQFLDYIFDDKDQMIFILVSITDISHLGYDGKAKLTIFDTSNDMRKVYYSHTPADETPEESPLVKFSPRQKEIIHLMGQGYASKQIADLLHISQNTVNNHRSNILKLANVPNSAALLVFANRHGLI